MPFYLAMGMTAEEYWDGSPMLAKAYREADRLKKKRDNEKLWVQGMYIYEALCDVSPIFNPFAKRGTKAHPYAENPYPLNEKDKKEIEERTARKNQNNIMSSMKRFAEQFNAQFKKKQE